MTNKDNLLDSAAELFRSRLSSGSRFHALLDDGSTDVAGADNQVLAPVERGELSLPYSLRLSRSAESVVPQIGDMPPQPPTLRGRIGAALVQAVRRGLFWYTSQIRAFQGMVAEAAHEQITALQELDTRQQRQQAMMNDTLKRLSDLERERAQTSEQLSALGDRVSAVPDRLSALEDRLNGLPQLLSGLEDRLNSLPQRVSGLEDRLNGVMGEFSSSRARIDAYEKQLQGLRTAHEELRDELYQKLIAAEQSRAAVEEDEQLHRTAFDSRVGQIEERLADVGRGIEAGGREVRRQMHKERTRLLQQEFRLNLLLREVRKDAHGEGLADAARTIAEDIGRANETLFMDHARAFRGERAEIKSRLAVYAPYVQQAFAAAASAPALDLGCGRGEWLELLREMEIPASGIDWNRELIEGCRERGFHVSQGGIPRILNTIPDESLSLVTAFHVLEHIAFSDLLEVIDHAVRMLKPGGLAIFETPNPKNSFVSSNNFYLDPTHRHPIPSELLAFVVEARGLCDPKVMPLSPYPDHFHLPGAECPAVQFINDHFYGPQDYGIVAFKAS